MDDVGADSIHVLAMFMRRLATNASDGNTSDANSTVASVNVTSGNLTADATSEADSTAPPSPPDSMGETDMGWTMLIGGFLIFTSIFVCAVICVLRGTGTIPKNKVVRRCCMITDG